MKINTIFFKNLKIISRNGSYFAALFLFPLILILVSTAMLNSNDFKNLKIGIIDTDPEFDFNLKDIQNSINYKNVGDCMIDLMEEKIGVCISVKQISGKRVMSIYIDNTQGTIKIFVKEFILENIHELQTASLNETSAGVELFMDVYTNSIKNASLELGEVVIELENQEKILLDYKSDLTDIRRDFDSVYYDLKKSENDIKNAKNDIESLNRNLEGNLSEFEQKKQEIEVQLRVLKSYLSQALSSGEYNTVMSYIEPIEENLNDIEQILQEIEKNKEFTEDLVVYLDNLENILEQMETTKKTLDDLDRNLDISIEKLRVNRHKIENFNEKIQEDYETIEELTSGLSGEGISVKFYDAFDEVLSTSFRNFPILVAIIITFTSFVLSNMFILKQLNLPSYKRDLITPTSDWIFLFADYITNLFFVVIQGIVIFFIALILFKAPMTTLLPFVLSIFLASSFFIFLGLFVGNLFKSQSISMLVTIFILIFFIIMSDLLVQSILSSDLIRLIIECNPFVILIDILKDSFIFKKTFTELIPSFIKLSFYPIVMFFLTFISKKICRNKMIQ